MPFSGDHIRTLIAHQNFLLLANLEPLAHLHNYKMQMNSDHLFVNEYFHYLTERRRRRFLTALILASRSCRPTDRNNSIILRNKIFGLNLVIYSYHFMSLFTDNKHVILLQDCICRYFFLHYRTDNICLRLECVREKGSAYRLRLHLYHV